MAEEGRRQDLEGEEQKTEVPGMEGYWVLHIEIATNYIGSSIGEDRD